MMQKALLHAAGILCLVVSVLPTSSAYVLAPTHWSRKATLLRSAATPHLRPTSLKMSGAMDMEGEDNGADKDVPALVPPPAEDSIRNLLPSASTPTTADFLTELVLGKLPTTDDGSLLDGNPDSEPVSVPVGGETVELGEVVRPMMSMIFTCNVCETRQMRSFTRLAYEKGIVIVTCKGCESKHLIADNLGWYRDWLEKGDQNVQDIMRRKGVEVPRIQGEEAVSLYEEWIE